MKPRTKRGVLPGLRADALRAILEKLDALETEIVDGGAFELYDLERGSVARHIESMRKLFERELSKHERELIATQEAL